MKKILTFTLLIFSLVSNAQCNEVAIGAPRIEQIFTEKENVFLLVNNKWIVVDAFQANHEGTFVLYNGAWMTLTEYMGTYFTWTCTNCNTVNVQGAMHCRKCGR